MKANTGHVFARILGRRVNFEQREKEMTNLLPSFLLQFDMVGLESGGLVDSFGPIVGKLLDVHTSICSAKEM
jgi:hypothetical protein